MKTLVALLFLFPVAVYGQRYEYCKFVDFGGGVLTRGEFDFGSKYDSTKAYGKFDDGVDALDFANKRGWELIHVTAGGESHITYIFRRRILEPAEVTRE